MGFAAGAIAAATVRERYPDVVVLGWTGESQRASTPRSPVQEPKCDVWTPQLLEFFYSQILPLSCDSRQVPLKRPRKTFPSCVHVCLFGTVGESAGRNFRNSHSDSGSRPAWSDLTVAFCTRVNLLLSFFSPFVHQQNSRA